LSQPSTSTFASLNLHPELLAAIKAAGFTTPTPVQAKAIPPAITGRDVLACAMTGSGKTAAFLLPLIERLRAAPRGKTRALVLTPTRELAAQIVEHGKALSGNSHVRLAAIYGGVGIAPQIQAFRSGIDILVACPGRLLDILARPSLGLPDLDVLVLDEADRMLDMGFLPDVKKVLARIPKPKQTLFFSATLPPPIVELSKVLLKNPVMIDVERQVAPSTQVDQAVYAIPESSKRHLLLELLRRGNLEQVLVFTRTKHRADRLAEFLKKHGVGADRIHANRSQNQRTKALADFKDGYCKVLVATDIAARGIDVEALPHVVNFDVPNVPEDYVHRIGRTGRAALTGDAFTFVSPAEENYLRAIERVLGKRIERLKLEGFDPTVSKSDEPLEIPLNVRLAAMRAARAPKKKDAAAAAGRPAGARPAGSRPAGSRPAGSRPAGSRPATSRPGAPARDDRHAGARPAGSRPVQDSRNDRPREGARAEAGRGEAGRGEGRREGYRSEGPRQDFSRYGGGQRSEGQRSEGQRSEGQRSEGQRDGAGRSESFRSEVARATSPRPASGRPVGIRPSSRPTVERSSELPVGQRPGAAGQSRPPSGQGDRPRRRF